MYVYDEKPWLSLYELPKTVSGKLLRRELRDRG